jgi:integrase
MNDEKMKLPAYSGPFKEVIPQYIQARNAMGLKYDWRLACYLRDIDKFAASRGITKPEIPKDLYDEFTRARPGEKEGTTQIRRSTIRPFARYLLSLGYENVHSGADDKRIFKREFVPYIFSKEDAVRMFALLDKRHAENPCMEEDAFRVAMQMYYCCGFRRSEVQKLQVGNVNLETGKITILEGKNNISRIVMASDSLLCSLKEYAEAYLKNASEEEYFLYPGAKRHTVENKIYDKYRSLLVNLEIVPRKDGGYPRLHDLRHTFCVRALEQMQEKGYDLYTSLPILSKYLGHNRLTETEYYLRLLDEHFAGIISKADEYGQGLYSCDKTDDTPGGKEAVRGD